MSNSSSSRYYAIIHGYIWALNLTTGYSDVVHGFGNSSVSWLQGRFVRFHNSLDISKLDSHAQSSYISESVNVIRWFRMFYCVKICKIVSCKYNLISETADFGWIHSLIKHKSRMGYVSSACTDDWEFLNSVHPIKHSFGYPNIFHTIWKFWRNWWMTDQTL